MGIEVMDQRRLLGPWLVGSEQVRARAPSEAGWAEVRGGRRPAHRPAHRGAGPQIECEWTQTRGGWRRAHALANRGVGQTVVRARGVTVAVEAAEGTDE